MFNHLMSAKTKLEMEAAPLVRPLTLSSVVFYFPVNWCVVIRWTSNTLVFFMFVPLCLIFVCDKWKFQTCMRSENKKHRPYYEYTKLVVQSRGKRILGGKDDIMKMKRKNDCALELNSSLYSSVTLSV